MTARVICRACGAQPRAEARSCDSYGSGQIIASEISSGKAAYTDTATAEAMS